ncbi:MAG: sulfatase family protein [Planctomycetota bacterium]|jgi:arylsulfatase A-like enzyme
MKRPNIVFIITDNQSPWTLGCYGNREILTPNVDRLAAGGIRFDNTFCVNPVCSPNRATCLTGLMPSQHGVHRWLGVEKPDAQMGSEAYCVIDEFANLPRILADEGYRCGHSGKWHLGDSAHPQLGFEYWYAMTQGHTASFYNMKVAWQGEVVEEPKHFVEATAEHAVDFLDQQSGDTPFFLHVGFNGPYCVDGDLLSGHRNRHAAYYADKELECFPRTEPHEWQKTFRQAFGNPVARRSYAAAISGVDDGVGAILDKLDAMGVADDTIVVYTADHGACAGHNGLWGMGEHARPFNVTQTTMRVPMIVGHPNRIPAGGTLTEMTSHVDFLPSILSHLGLSSRLPDGMPLAGRDYAPALTGKACDLGDEIVFAEYETTRLVTTPRWKLIRRHGFGPDQLFNLAADPEETTSLLGTPEAAEAEKELSNRLDEFFAQHKDPQYDVWGGGRSKGGDLITSREDPW